MPLRCLNEYVELAAYNFDEHECDELKKLNNSYHHLKMHCCDSRVVLKKSSLGTQFFAHAKKGVCITAPESVEHLFAKSQVASALNGTDWSARTEVMGITPAGEQWTADVLAERESKKVAIEIQWSPQNQDETQRRQKRYDESGVLGLWLFKKPTNLLSEKHTPAFLLEVDVAAKVAKVKLQSDRYFSYARRDIDLRAEKNWAQTIELQRFIRGSLTGALQWAPGLNQILPFEIHGAQQTCWKCHQLTRIVTALVFRVDQVFKGARSLSGRLSDFDSPIGKKCFNEAIASLNLRNIGVGVIKDRYSRTMGGSYLSNGCIHCDALQGAFFDHEVWHEAELISTTECKMLAALFEDDSRIENPHYWWFDEKISY